MKQKIKELRIAIVLGVITISVVLYFGIRETLAGVYGKEVTAIVVSLPENCRSPVMKVHYNDESYNMRITRTDCYAGTYAPGNNVTLKYYEPLNIMIWPKGWMPASSLLILVIIGVVVAVIWLRIRSSKKN